eukprot:jgi/Mesvir1/8395/Mv12639-RA.1
MVVSAPSLSVSRAPATSAAQTRSLSSSERNIFVEAARAIGGKSQANHRPSGASKSVVCFGNGWETTNGCVGHNKDAPNGRLTGLSQLTTRRTFKRGVSVDANAGNTAVDSNVRDTVDGHVRGTNGSSAAHADGDAPQIHPTAVVDPAAVIGKGVVIGPLCTVGPRVTLGDRCVLHPGCHIHGETSIGADTKIHSGAVVGEDLPGTTIIGQKNIIGCHAVVGCRCQDLKYKAGEPCFLVIGDGNDIREHCSVHRSSRADLTTVIGNRNLIMGSCHIAHDCIIGNFNILANVSLFAGHVVIEDNVHTGGATAVHQFCHLGRHCFVAGGSMVDRDVPSFAMVAGDRAELRGLNVEGMRRARFTEDEMRNIRTAYSRLFISKETTSVEAELAALEADTTMNVPGSPAAIMIESIKGSLEPSRRGICKHRARGAE